MVAGQHVVYIMYYFMPKFYTKLPIHDSMNSLANVDFVKLSNMFAAVFLSQSSKWYVINLAQL